MNIAELYYFVLGLIIGSAATRTFFPVIRGKVPKARNPLPPPPKEKKTINIRRND